MILWNFPNVLSDQSVLLYLRLSIGFISCLTTCSHFFSWNSLSSYLPIYLQSFGPNIWDILGLFYRSITLVFVHLFHSPSDIFGLPNNLFKMLLLQISSFCCLSFLIIVKISSNLPSSGLVAAFNTCESNSASFSCFL